MSRPNFVLSLVLVAAVPALAQQASPLNCVVAAVPALVRSEGLAEKLGDIVLNCSGGAAGGTVTGNLTLFLSTNITNKLSANNSLDVFLTVDTGSGQRSAGATAISNALNTVLFQGMNFTLSNSGTAILRITNLRGAASLVPDQPITARLANAGPSSITIQSSPQIVGIPQPGMLANYSSTFVCPPSMLPSEVTFANLIRNGTRFSSIRVTEGSADAFQKRQANTDNGVRVVVKFTNYPPGARVLVPDVIAGSDATQPTAGGDMGVTASGGSYTAGGSGSLLLVRIRNAASDGSGGVPVYVPPAPGSAAVSFDGVSDVELASGSGHVVYEVADSSAATRESAQFPVFLALASRPEGAFFSADVAVMIGPVSKEFSASQFAPVPRFMQLPPPPDCQALGDCTAAYQPRLEVTAAAPLEFTAIAGSAFQVKYVQIRNDAGGILNWTASVRYQNGSGWILLDPEYGFNGGTVRIDVLPAKLAPGRYEAVLTIDAGPLSGSRTLPVRLTVTEFVPPPVQPPEVRGVSNAGSREVTSLVAGSLATITGSRFQGSKVEVAIGGQVARILYKDDTQINVEVPASLPAQGTVQLLVTVDGRASVARAVTLAPSAPAIFPGAVLNQDNSANAAANPAQAGSIMQIFLTGLPSSGVTAKLGNSELTDLLYAGPAPGLPGVQQVNLAVPAEMQPATVDLRVCAQAACSPPVPLTIGR